MMLAGAASAQQSSFSLVPRAGDGSEARVIDLSGDGTAVLTSTGQGPSIYRPGTQAFQTLAPISGQFTSAARINRDGSVVVGSSFASGGPSLARRWINGGLVSMNPGFPTFASAVNASGSVIGGGAGGVAARWTQAAGFEPIPGLAGIPGAVDDLDDDGGVAVGSIESGAPSAFRWRAGIGTEFLALPQGAQGARAQRVSGDGRITAGLTLESNGGARLVRWDHAGSALVLDTPAGMFLPGEVSGIDLTGQTIVGSSNDAVFRAFIWKAGAGVMPMSAYLEDAGLSTGGLILTSVVGVSDDGLRFAGTGFRIGPGGIETESWVATIPGPGVAWVLGAGLAFGTRRRRSYAGA
jgi:uncharacterized membrane protein